MSKHTPEPWHRDGMHINAGHDSRIGTAYTVAGVPYNNNAARIVACVNALAGRDPAKLPELEKAAAEAESILRFVRFRGLGDLASQMKPEELEVYETKLRTALAAFRKEGQ